MKEVQLFYLWQTTLAKLLFTTWCLVPRVNFDSITLMVDIGGKDLLLKENNFGRTALHLVSMEEESNKDVLLYLISIGGSDLRRVEDDNGMKAKDYMSPELKQYIDLHTKTSPDLQCPICFEIMNDVNIIPRCCHRFCKKCITDAFNRNGKNCPSFDLLLDVRNTMEVDFFERGMQKRRLGSKYKGWILLFTGEFKK